MFTRTRPLHLTIMLPLLCLSIVLPRSATAKDPIKGFIDSFGYGYDVKVCINGTPMTVIKGKGQQATRLFSADHPMKKDAAPEQQSIFILKEGENTITVEFRKLEESGTALEIRLEIPDRYSKPLFHLKSATARSGTLERKFLIEKKMPKKFKTIEVNDDMLK